MKTTRTAGTARMGRYAAIVVPAAKIAGWLLLVAFTGYLLVSFWLSLVHLDKVAR